MAKKHEGTADEAKKVEERSALKPPVIYEIVRRRGDEEMERPAVSLWWSGVAAGLSISFSLLAQSLLEQHLPDAPWRPLVSSFGYAIGFLMVILGRQQLFTENTLTAVLPVMAEWSLANLGRLARMWAIVWLANMAGCLFAALFCSFTPVITPDQLAAMVEVSRNITGHAWLETFFKAITAGFIIAAMVWLLPSAESAQFWVITLMTWLIAASESMHVVAGSVEGFLLVAQGELGAGQMIVGFTIPVLLGNIIGGTALFAVLSHAQVMREI